MEQTDITSLIPIVITLVLSLATRNVVIGLFAGVLLWAQDASGEGCVQSLKFLGRFLVCLADFRSCNYFERFGSNSLVVDVYV